MNRSHRTIALFVALAAVVVASALALDEPTGEGAPATDVASDDRGAEDGDAGTRDDPVDGARGGAVAGLGAHEHGVADLTVAWSGGEMLVDLISPGFNIFGFEYEPSTEEDIALVEERTAALTAPGMIAVNEEAGCDLVGDVVTEVEYEGRHAELTASWEFACENPGEIRRLDTAPLFAAFANLEDITVQWASDSEQSAAELSPSAASLRLT